MVGLELDMGISLGEGGCEGWTLCEYDTVLPVYIFQYAEGRAILT